MNHIKKRCNRCGELQPAEYYYARNNICKKCKRAYRRWHYIKNKEATLLTNRKYKQRKEYKIKRARQQMSLYYKNVKKYRCRGLSWYYVKRGEIVRTGCEVCGKKAEMHHLNYDDPKNIMWLCRTHHIAIERKAP
jgi:hypothetical protein